MPLRARMCSGAKFSSFLNNECDSCEVVDLIEQPPEGPDGRGWGFLRESGWYWEKSPDAIDYYIPLKGSWEDYLKTPGLPHAP